MNEDTKVVADNDDVDHKNDVVAESSTAPVVLECNVSHVCSQMSLLNLCLC